MCACDSAAEFDFGSPEEARASLKIAETLVMIQHCEHVGISDLLPADSKACAIYFSNCYDRGMERTKCTSAGDSSLLCFGLRSRSNSRYLKPSTTSVTVTTAPSQHLALDNGSDDNGKCTLKAGSYVMFPFYRALNKSQYWHKRVPLIVQRSRDVVFASINVKFEIDPGTDPFKSAISLPISIAPEGLLGNTDQIQLPEQSRMIDPISNTILAESVKLLLKEGWKFFKENRVIRHDDDLISLNIGSAVITLQDTTDDRIEKLVAEVHPGIASHVELQLDGLNQKLRQLYIRKRNLVKNELSSSNTIELSNLQTYTQITTEEISRVQSEIWDLLQKTGMFSAN